MSTRILSLLTVISLAACEVSMPVSVESPKDDESAKRIEKAPETSVIPETPETSPLPSCNDNSTCPRDLYTAQEIFTWGELFSGDMIYDRNSQATYFSKLEIKTGTIVSVYHLERITDVFVNLQTLEIHLTTELGDKLMPLTLVSDRWTGQRYVASSQTVNDSWLTVRNARWLDENTAAVDLCMYQETTGCHTITKDVN